jgi:hypothetical protein
LGEDEGAYNKLMEPLVTDWPRIIGDVLAPLHFPKHPFEMARFGWKAASLCEAFKQDLSINKSKGVMGGHDSSCHSTFVKCCYFRNRLSINVSRACTRLADGKRWLANNC